MKTLSKERRKRTFLYLVFLHRWWTTPRQCCWGCWNHCWPSSRSSSSCALSPVGCLAEAGASQSVQTQLGKQKYPHYIPSQGEEGASRLKGRCSFTLRYLLPPCSRQGGCSLFREMPLGVRQPGASPTPACSRGRPGRGPRLEVGTPLPALAPRTDWSR